MFILIVIIHVMVSLVIIGLVLLQSGKGADIGSAFGGAGSQAVFGSMGTPTVLGKITTVAASLFLITSFSLAVLSHKHAGPQPIGTAPGEEVTCAALVPSHCSASRCCSPSPASSP